MACPDEFPLSRYASPQANLEALALASALADKKKRKAVKDFNRHEATRLKTVHRSICKIVAQDRAAMIACNRSRVRFVTPCRHNPHSLCFGGHVCRYQFTQPKWELDGFHYDFVDHECVAECSPLLDEDDTVLEHKPASPYHVCYFLPDMRFISQKYEIFRKTWLPIHKQCFPLSFCYFEEDPCKQTFGDLVEELGLMGLGGH